MEDSSNKNDSTDFKKPVLFGRIGKLPKKVKLDSDNQTEGKDEESNPKQQENNPKSSLPPAVLIKELSTPVPYKEPKWSGVCPDGSEYALEVLKSGMIVERIELTNKSFYVFGRLANCDVVMAHPTISRHHSVLQYKAFADEGEPPCGWYLYDLGSTHGTYLNRDRLKEKHYTRVRVGHQIKFGNSSRTYIMIGPDFDSEGESELTVTEIKQKAQDLKLERTRMIQEAKEKIEKERLEEEKRREEQGIDWGMGEDAEEDPDLAENPYASTGNEELYLTDPKKTLRGYFEREGHELNYDCEERGIGQFICRVELPIDDPHGRPVLAEVIHRGKKKEAVVACALEACRILDRAGLLRQSKHESKRRKERDWSADDYYDSDDDSFLDRTGHVERKRRLRMMRHGATEERDDGPLTYDDLVKRAEEIEGKIASEEKSLERLRSAGQGSNPRECGDADALDAYMSELTAKRPAMAVKADISRTKMNIQKLKAELAKTHRLADIARPADALPLIKKDDKKLTMKVGTNSIVYGKRLKLKDEKRPKVRHDLKKEEEEFVEEMDSDEETTVQEQKTETQELNVKEEHSIESETLSERRKEEKEDTKSVEDKAEKEDNKPEVKRVYGPMRPPDDYVVPEGYFDQETDRDLPEIEEKE